MSKKIRENRVFFDIYLIQIKFIKNLSDFQKAGSHALKVQLILFKIKQNFSIKNKKHLKKKIFFLKDNVKNFEVLITLFFENFFSAPLQSPISQKLLDENEQFFFPFKTYEIAFNMKYFVSMETH